MLFTSNCKMWVRIRRSRRGSCHLNTLFKLREQIEQPLVPPPPVSYITPFAAIYHRIFELFVGQSMLDVGCSFGFLPVLLAEREPTALLMGCDKSRDAIAFSTDLADKTGIRQVVFTMQDLLDETVHCLGTFETVTAIHVLEHIGERDLPVALTHLLQLASKRLIIAVPYGHEQIFTSEKLERWGQWCVENLQESGRYWCEDVAGGLLVVDRLLEEK